MTSLALSNINIRVDGKVAGSFSNFMKYIPFVGSTQTLVNFSKNQIQTGYAIQKRYGQKPCNQPVAIPYLSKPRVRTLPVFPRLFLRSYQERYDSCQKYTTSND